MAKPRDKRSKHAASRGAAAGTPSAAPRSRAHDGSAAGARDLRSIGVCLVLVMLVAVVYAQLGSHQFIHFDDDEYIYNNPHVATGLSAANVAWAMTAYHSNNWHPLTWISHMVDVQLFGLNPGPHHLMTVALHAANAILLFVLLLRLTGGLWRSAIVAAVFAVHPLHVESVAWASERKDVLSTLLGLLTLHAYTAYARRPRAAGYVAVLVLFALGIMAKPMLVTLPFVLLLLDYWPLRRFGQAAGETRRAPATPLQRLVVEKLPMLAIVVASSALTLAAQSRGGVVRSLEELSVTMRLANAIASYARYAGKILVPLTQAFYYPYPEHPPVLAALLSVIVIAVVSWWCWRHRRDEPWGMVGWLWFLGTLVPVIGLVQVATQAIADRYTYIPSIGLSIAVVWTLADLARRRRAWRAPLLGLAGVAITAMAARATVQAGYWRDGVTLFTHDTQVVKDDVLADRNLGVSLTDLGRNAEAIPCFERVLQHYPHDAVSLFDVAVAYDRLGKAPEAERDYRASLAYDPGRAEARYNLATLLNRAGRVDEAIAEFDSTIRQDPGFADAYNNLGNALAKAGRDSEAVERYRDAIARNPGYAQAHNNLGTVYRKLGRAQQALDEYSEALRLDPAFAEAELNTGVAWLDRGDTAAARRHFDAAVRLKPELSAAIPPQYRSAASTP